MKLHFIFWMVSFMGVVAGVRAASLPSVAVAPEVFAGISGISGDGIEPGEPFFVRVRVEAPFESVKPVELAPEKGAWVDGVTFEIEKVGVAAGALLVSPRPAGTGLKIDADSAVSGEWLMPTAATSKLAPGTYRLLVTLRIQGVRGWSGSVTAEPLDLKVVQKPDSIDRTVQRAIAHGSEALVAGNFEAAAKRVDTVLATNPDNVRLLTLRAKISTQAGDLRGAMHCVNRALTTGEVESALHPPIALFELEGPLSEAMMAAGWYERELPAWTKLPDSVLAPRLSSKPLLEVPALTVSQVPRPLPVPSGNTSPTAAPVTTTVSTAVSTPPASSKPLTPTAPAPLTISPVQPLPTKPGAPTAGVLVATSDLAEEKILADPLGQWASGALAGSRYSSGAAYSPEQATGAPNVPRGSDNANAWCHSGDSKGIEWLELVFAKPVRATEVRVRQTLNPGTIIKLEAIEPDGTSHVWWEGSDAGGRALSAGTIAWFAVRVPKGDYPVARVKVTLDLKLRVGWKQIDAVQLVGKPE